MKATLNHNPYRKSRRRQTSDTCLSYPSIPSPGWSRRGEPRYAAVPAPRNSRCRPTGSRGPKSQATSPLLIVYFHLYTVTLGAATLNKCDKDQLAPLVRSMHTIQPIKWDLVSINRTVLFVEVVGMGVPEHPEASSVYRTQLHTADSKSSLAYCRCSIPGNPP